MRELNPEHVEALIRIINNGPYLRLLAMQVRELRAGYCRVETSLDQMHENPFGGLHGGLLSSIVDTSAYWAVYGDVDEDAGLVSVDLSVDFWAMSKAGPLTAEGRLVRAGRNICMAEATIIDANGKTIAHGDTKIMVTKGLQTVPQLAAAVGHPPLPPKYLEDV